MRLKPKSNKKMIITVAGIASTLLIASLLLYYSFSSRGNEDSQTKSKPQGNDPSISKEVPDEDKPNSLDDEIADRSVQHEKEKELPQLYEGENTNSTSGLTGVITTKSIIGNNLVIRNSIDQMVSGGTCDLSLTSNGRTVSRSVEIIQNPSSSTCAGFDIPMSELGPGQWDLSIKVTSENKSMILKESVSI